jgi:hypothetical protein
VQFVTALQAVVFSDGHGASGVHPHLAAGAHDGPAIDVDGLAVVDVVMLVWLTKLLPCPGSSPMTLST